VNANFGPQNIPILSEYFQANIADFDDFWFIDIGNTLIGAMLFNVYFPVIEFFMFWCLRQVKRFLDGGRQQSKRPSIKQYCDVYMGPVYMIHFKYSSVLNITFVTFMYGYGMPILFPVAALSFLTLYVMEKAMIYYSYRQPPMYDNVLNDSVLDKMKWAPFLYLALGYWMITNPTLFGNDPVPVNRINGK